MIIPGRGGIPMDFRRIPPPPPKCNHKPTYMSEIKAEHRVGFMTIKQLLEFIKSNPNCKLENTANCPTRIDDFLMSRTPVELLLYAKELSLKPESNQETKGPDKPKSKRERFLAGEEFTIDCYRPGSRLKYNDSTKEISYRPFPKAPFVEVAKVTRISDDGLVAAPNGIHLSLDLDFEPMIFDFDEKQSGADKTLDNLFSKLFGAPSLEEKVDEIISKIKDIPGVEKVEVFKMPCGQKH